MLLERGYLLNGRYRIIEVLGQGGMGSVYRAVDENLGVEVAVKDNLFTTEEYARQFRREAVILANLRHPNLPRVTDHFVISGQGQYLVMDYIEGEDLRQRMERMGTISEEEAITIGAAICDALAFLGTRKPPIIHRDIKPGNVKITPQGQILLVDFGLAKTLQSTHPTTTGARAMTPGYSPPEQYGTARTDQRSDIFSLGATLYAALSGCIPEDALARAMEQEELTPLRKHNPHISKRLAAAIEKALEVRPEDRYQTAEDFKEALLSASTLPRRSEGEFLVTPPPEEKPATQDSNLMAPMAEIQGVPLDEAISETPSKENLAKTPKKRTRSRSRPRRGYSGSLGCWIALFIVIAIFGGAGYAFYRSNPDLPKKVLTQLWPVIIASLPTPTSSAEPETGITPSDTQPLWTDTPASVASENPITSLAPFLTETLPLVTGAVETPTITSTPQGGGGGQIAFASDGTGTNQIYIINTDGSGLFIVTDMPEGACQPEWSPDGTRLVFISPCSINKDYYPGSALFIINVDGTGLLPLPTQGGGDYDPAWSPDGIHLAFTSLRNNGRSQIYVMNLQDYVVTPLSDPFAYDGQPSWSKDGKQIIFTRSTSGSSQIWVMDSDGQNPVQFSFSQNLHNFHPFWSPDGRLVIFTQYNVLGGIPRVMIAPFLFDKYSEYRLGQDTMPMRDAVFSPDGYWVAFEGWIGGNHDIYIISATGAGRIQVTTDPRTDFDPAWKPTP